MAERKAQPSLMPGHRTEAARLVIEPGRPIAHVASELGLGGGFWWGVWLCPHNWWVVGALGVLSGGVLLSHTLACAVPSALGGLTSGFGMGPGVSLSPWPP